MFLPAGNLIKKSIYKTEKKANEGAQVFLQYGFSVRELKEN